ncbi:hypothetical protein SKAU_G00156200 [Synaphobranchus kaupii]|uniref:Uncharacterized protein n=1 Tax=Synaphobranchus kaupii TaxID=118154 RepID=A0A9Q1FHM4_SYNKA|nr:hypothetical protein SKAU_G00156200 [Synaphobranchus kaupii]
MSSDIDKWIDGSVEEIVGHERISEDIQRLDTILKVVKKNVDKSQQTTRRLKSRSSKPGFKVGDRVWRQNTRSQQRKGGKLDANFLGPYTIKALQGKSADLEGENGQEGPPHSSTSGPDTSGPDTSGPDTSGPDTSGPDTSGPDTSGPDTSGPDTSGPDTSGPNICHCGP